MNNKKYVGQTTRSIDTRIREHLLSINTGPEYQLSRAIRKYGWDVFKVSVIENPIIYQLNEREIYWIAHYDSFQSGYNMTIGGDGYRIISDEEANKMHEMWKVGHTLKSIATAFERAIETVTGTLYQFGISEEEITARIRDNEGFQRVVDRTEVLRLWESGLNQKEIAEKIGCYSSSIGPILNEAEVSKTERQLRNHDLNSLDVVQIDSSRRIVGEFVSIHEAERALSQNAFASGSNIGEAIRLGIMRYGYYWALKGDLTEEEINTKKFNGYLSPPVVHSQKQLFRDMSKAVIQFNLKKKPIEQYQSMSEAAKKTGLERKRIQRATERKRAIEGFYFELKSEYFESRREKLIKLEEDKLKELAPKFAITNYSDLESLITEIQEKWLEVEIVKNSY